MKLSERQFDLTLLLRSDDWFRAGPKTWSGELVRRHAEPGEGPSHRELCDVCDGMRFTVDRFKRHFPCQACGGTETEPGRGWVERDAYTGRKVGSLDSGQVLTRTRTVRCDACDKGSVNAGRWRGENNKCLRCNGSGVLELSAHFVNAKTISADAPLLGAGDPVLACMEYREKIGSYSELGLALNCLRRDHRAHFRLVVRVYMLQQIEVEQLSQDLHVPLLCGLGYLEQLMPTPIVVPSSVRAAERRRRYEMRKKVAA